MRMRKFNKDDYELVKSYEKDFTRAIESRFCTGLLKEELEVVSRVYKETLSRQANLSCGACVLQMMTSVGRLYFAYKKETADDEEEQKKVMELMGIASKLVRCGECANTHRPDQYTIWCTARGFPEQLVARDGFCVKGRKNNV